MFNIFTELIDSLVNCFTYIINFIRYLISIPVYLESWYLELPSFVATGMSILLICVTAVIVINICFLLKEVFL